MKTLDVDEVKVPAYVVRQDVADQYAKFWSTFSLPKQRNATKLKGLAQSAYFRSKVYLNAREQFLVVKVDRPQVADKLQNTTELANLYAFTKLIGIEPVATKNSLLFRISH